MSINHVTCVTVTCGGCKEEAPLYDDMGTAHFPSVDEARKQLVTDHADEPEYQWSIDGEDWFCASCTAARACEAAGGHDWGDWDVPYAGLDEFRSCRRGHCQQSERRRPVPITETGDES